MIRDADTGSARRQVHPDIQFRPSSRGDGELRGRYHELGHRADEIGAVARVILNDRPFFRSQLVLLGKNCRILLVDLSNVVKQCGAANLFNLRFREAQMRAR